MPLFAHGFSEIALLAAQMEVVGTAGAEAAGETKTGDTTCPAGGLGAAQALGLEKGIWVSEAHPEGTPMTTASTLLTLGNGLRTSCETCIWSVPQHAVHGAHADL